MSIDGLIDKENMVDTHNRILFSIKKEGNPVICYNVYETKGQYTKWSKLTQKDKYCMIPITWCILSGQTQKHKVEWWSPEAYIREKRALFGFARLKSSRHLLHNNMHIVNTTMHLKMVKEGNFTF